MKIFLLAQIPVFPCCCKCFNFAHEREKFIDTNLLKCDHKTETGTDKHHKTDPDGGLEHKMCFRFAVVSV